MVERERLTINRDENGFATAEIVVQRSKFLAEAHRVTSEQQARDVIAAIRARDFDARHHCSAFVIAGEQPIARSNDDGEPAGTAGRPILDQIDGRGLSDVVVVVTRWFGGVLLGTGGLTRAYGDAAAAALDVAGVRRRELWHRSAVTVELAKSGQLDYRLRQFGEVVDVIHTPKEARFEVAHRDRLPEHIEGVSVPVEELEPVWRDA